MRQRYNNFDTGLQTITIAASSHGWVSGFRHIAKDRKKFFKIQSEEKNKISDRFPVPNKEKYSTQSICTVCTLNCLALRTVWDFCVTTGPSQQDCHNRTAITGLP
jgi:hypothetical protein